ncbi:uncharacterized protein LOC123669478 [Melitaea cinxia]|uniref:uncharacterized protein LOC123669478 n=1 Tax=Melitaea cinxia TaxID=113334 RepID=UPI001E26F887|nr:uncharacterized protein LOC123669478 [Melitaea cinxia]
MGLRGICFVYVIFFVYLLQYADALPRLSSVEKTEILSELSGIPISTVKATPVQVVTESVAKIPGRVKCVNEEATEELVCQEHCLPKGYSYGICVRGTCSCI